MILGIILLLLGFSLFIWSGYWERQPKSCRPPIFRGIVTSFLIYLLYYGLQISGITLIFISNHKIGFVTISVYIIILVLIVWIFKKKQML